MITPRLDSIIRHIDAKNIADIGTDHAYIPIKLVKDRAVKYAIATDIKEGPLKIARQNVEKHSLTDKIELRLGSGLAPLSPGEADVIIIAGMGAQMITDILAKDSGVARSAKALVLQPMNAQYELRRWLLDNGYKLYKEDLSVEGFKVYNLIMASDGQDGRNFSEIDLHLPPYLITHPLYKMLYEKKHREFSKIAAGLLRAENQNYADILKYQKLLKELEERKPCF